MDTEQNEMNSVKKRLDDLEKIVKSGQNKTTDLQGEIQQKPIQANDHSDDQFIDKKTFLTWVAESENKFQGINGKIALLMERTDRLIDKFKSVRDLKKEFKAFLSLKGFSKILGTDSLFKKVLWFVSMITLFAVCMSFVGNNTKEYNENGVVTEIKNVEKETLIFPAVTVCLQTLELTVDSNGLPTTDNQMIPSNLNIISNCQYEHKPCSLNDFEYFPVYFAYQTYADDFYQNCYKFNGGRNASNHETELRSSTQFGLFNGLEISFILSDPQKQFISYFVGDNKVEPLFAEIFNLVQPGKIVNVGMKKTVDIKLPEPYNNCQDNINSETSHLVKQILEKNKTYRQINCYDLCLNEYEYKNDIPRRDAYLNSFDYPGNCSDLCPFECNTITFEINEYRLEYEDKVDSGFLNMNFFYSDKKYTEITQSEKTTGTDWLANNGGVLGLFLELSFFSIYRFILNVFDVLVRKWNF